MDIDHYAVLGLPSGEKGAKLSQQEIAKAYRSKAKELHPDKRLNHKDAAHADFLQLRKSYEILNNEGYRKFFDGKLRSKRMRVEQEEARRNCLKRQKVVYEEIQRRQKERKDRMAYEEIQRREKEKRDRMDRVWARFKALKKEVDKENVVRASWAKTNGKEEKFYTEQSIREIFEKFGVVEDVALGNSDTRGFALVLMASKDSVVAIYEKVFISGLLVVPLNKVNGEDERELKSLVGILNTALIRRQRGFESIPIE